jgi:hypothetical protein
VQVNQRGAITVWRRKWIVPSGFVNYAADDTAPFRLARMLRVGSNKNSPLPFLLANAHVASCGWLGIHEADLKAVGLGGCSHLWLTIVSSKIPCKKYGIH